MTGTKKGYETVTKASAQTPKVKAKSKPKRKR